MAFARSSGPPAVLVVCDARANAEALKLSLTERDSESLEITATTAEECARCVKHGAYDVVVIDVAISEGLRLIRQIKLERPGARIIAYGIPMSEREVLAWIRAGVIGCIERHATLQELHRAIQDAIEGKPACSSSLADALFVEVLHLGRINGKFRTAVADSDQLLTPREIEVLELISHGLSNKDIARTLSLQVPTVKSHIRHLLRKLGVRTRLEAAQFLSGRELTSPTSGL